MEPIKNLEEHRQNSLAFFGRIMANVSHEFNNAITVIGELSGLLEDLTYLAKSGKPIMPEKLEKITGNISTHVKKAKLLISNMNQFSHSVDVPLQQFDLNDVVENMNVLTERLIYRRRAEFSYQKKNVEITSDPFLVRQVLFTALDLAMQTELERPSINVNLDTDSGKNIIEVSCNDSGDYIESEKQWQNLKMDLEHIKGSLTLDNNGECFTIRVMIPRTLEAE